MVQDIIWHMHNKAMPHGIMGHGHPWLIYDMHIAMYVLYAMANVQRKVPYYISHRV